jgi:hypothetical protein
MSVTPVNEPPGIFRMRKRSYFVDRTKRTVLEIIFTTFETRSRALSHAHNAFCGSGRRGGRPIA